MKINNVSEFEIASKEKLLEWYKEKSKVKHTCFNMTLSDISVVWFCKTLQNYKCLLSAPNIPDGVYAEYTYNGDKEELYEDIYVKTRNKCYK